MSKTYISLEILGSLSFVLISVYFVDNYGLVGITYAYALNYLIYMFVMIYIFREVVR